MKTLRILVVLAATLPLVAQTAPKLPPNSPVARPAAPPPPPAPNLEASRQNLQHQIDDNNKDLQLDTAALQNLVEFQSFMAHNQRATQLQQQMESLNAAAARAASANTPKK